MSWRIERFKNLVTPNKNLCFQVYVCLSKRDFTQVEFATLENKYKKDMPEDGIFEIPRKNESERLFNPGYIMNLNGFHQAFTQTVQPVFISTIDYHWADVSEDDATQKMKSIIDRYIPNVERQCPSLQFGENLYATDEKQGIEFKYLVSNFNVTLCHPRDIGILMPINVIDGLHINPTEGGNNLFLKRVY